MKAISFLKGAAALLLATATLAVLFIAIFGWNWLRGPVERMVLERTGRQLVIAGDLKVSYDWLQPRLHMGTVSFANPLWARERQMVAADELEISIDLPQLLRQRIVLPEVRLQRPVIFLESASSGRKNWLLDRLQQDESARVQIGRLRLDQGTLGFDDALAKTSIRAELASSSTDPAAGKRTGLVFKARGTYKSIPISVQGSGGPVLALRDETTPYPLTIDAKLGSTSVQATGTVTSLIEIRALDMRLKLRGDNLEQLFPLLGIAFPATGAYVTEGHLLHDGKVWRYEEFSGLMGTSDIAGSLQFTAGTKRPLLSGSVVSSRLDLADLAPVIGARPGGLQTVKETAARTPARVLPDLPFKLDRWSSMDAEVDLRAKNMHGAVKLPLKDLLVHLSLRDSVLRLDPLNFSLAGGQLKGVISLDGRSDVIQAQAMIKARKVLLDELFPSMALGKTGVGEVNGAINLAGQGNSVARMLASANGEAALVVVGGKVSKLMMEKAGLHLWEILQLKLSGDSLVKLRCAVADFDVKNGKMQAQALVFDTQVTTLIGSGSIDLAKERLDLTFNQKTKDTSPVALRSPLYVRGSFAKPEIGVDPSGLAFRALGAIALGVVNPLLAIIPLIDAGPGADSDCRGLIREARIKK